MFCFVGAMADSSLLPPLIRVLPRDPLAIGPILRTLFVHTKVVEQVCVCVCVYVCVCVCVCVCVHVYVHVCALTLLSTTDECIHACAFTMVYGHDCICVHMHLFLNVRRCSASAVLLI